MDCSTISVRILFAICINIYLAQHGNCAEMRNNDYAIETDGIRYTYRASDNAKQHKDAEAHGEIIIEDIRSGAQMLREVTDLLPGCDNFPALSVVEISRPSQRGRSKSGVAFCGSLGGRHFTLRMYVRAKGMFSAADIDFYDTKPNITYDEMAKSQLSLVVRTVVQDDGEPMLPFVYKLFVDGSVFGFVPVHGNGANKYKEFYSNLISSFKNRKDLAAGAVAAILATEEREFICDKFESLKLEGFSEDTLQLLANRVSSIGFPSFNFCTCRKQ